MVDAIFTTEWPNRFLIMILKSELPESVSLSMHAYESALWRTLEKFYHYLHIIFW